MSVVPGQEPERILQVPPGGGEGLWVFGDLDTIITNAGADTGTLELCTRSGLEVVCLSRVPSGSFAADGVPATAAGTRSGLSRTTSD